MAEPVSTSTRSTPTILSTPPASSENLPLSRKRRRSSRQSPKSASHPKTLKAALSPEDIPKALTGVAALADEQQAKAEQVLVNARQTSPNSARKAIGELSGPQGGMSKLQDAPNQANLLGQSPHEIASSDQVSQAAEYQKLTSRSPNQGAVQTDVESTQNTITAESPPVATVTANGAPVASPAQMEDVLGEDDEARGHGQHPPLDGSTGIEDPDESRSNKAFTYPGPGPSLQAHRTSSLPQSGYGGGRDSNRSPSTKRHKCPYCSTDFTRHHNLKSHLLTHSHEKPYSCDTCEARFRRLHDLKRHTKLHTGERPHVCPRCDRSFARGDALARHTKGQGGCAGRRSSLGSFGGDDKNDGGIRAGDGDSMPGIMYTGEASHEPEDMDEDAGSPGGKGLPSIRKHEAPPLEHHRQHTDHSSLFQPRQPSTYPPVAARPPQGGLYPPPSTSPRSGSGIMTTQSSLNQPTYPSSSAAPLALSSSGPNVFAQGGMTESPKPLSPAGMTSHQLGHSEAGIHRNRSPSLTQHMQQQQFGRRMATNNASPPMNLPPPQPNIGHSNAPQLPSLPGLNPPEARFTLQSQSSGPPHLHANVLNSLPGPPHGPESPSHPPGNASSANNSLSSHSTGPQVSFDRPVNSYNQPNDHTLNYIRSLEAKIDRLQDEFTSFKQQLGRGSQP